jgi:hypothetical protein
VYKINNLRQIIFPKNGLGKPWGRLAPLFLGIPLDQAFEMTSPEATQ